MFFNTRMETGRPRFHMGICDPRYHTVIPGNPRIRTGIDVISIPVWKRGVPVPIWGFVNPRYPQRQGGFFLFLGQNFRWHAGAPVTQGKAKTLIPITTQGVPVLERAGGQKKSHMGSPRSWKKFVTIWGVTYTPTPLTFSLACVSSKKEGRLPTSLATDKVIAKLYYIGIVNTFHHSYSQRILRYALQKTVMF